MINIACVVEGHGDVEAVPIVIRRIAESLYPAMAIHIPPPIRIPKDKLIKPGEIERATELAARKIGSHGAIFIVLDSDDDCPAEVGPELLQRSNRARSDMFIAVVLAKREFESWFLAAAESLRGYRGLSASLESPPDPETIQGAKEWLSQQMEGGRVYSETLDQPAFAASFDLEMARRVDSFDKFYRDIVQILAELQKSGRTNFTDSDSGGGHDYHS